MLLYGKNASAGETVGAFSIARSEKIYVNVKEACEADWDVIDDISTSNYDIFVDNDGYGSVEFGRDYIGLTVSITDDLPCVYLDNMRDGVEFERYLYINNTEDAIDMDEHLSWMTIEGSGHILNPGCAILLAQSEDDTYLATIFKNSDIASITVLPIRGELKDDPSENLELLSYVSGFVSLSMFASHQRVFGTLDNIPQSDDSEVNFITADGDDITAYLYDNAGDYSVRTDAGRLILVNDNYPEGVDFCGTVDGVVVVGKGPKIVNITFNDVAHMHFELEGDVIPHVGDDVTVLVVPEEGWEVASDGSGSPSISVNGEEVELEPVIDSYNKYAVATMNSEDVTIALVHTTMREAE